MRRILMILAISLLCIWGYGLTIEVADYGYGDGKIRNYNEGLWTASGTDLSEGTNKTWSFSLPTAGYVNNTFHNVQNVSGFPGANMSAAYDQYTLDYHSSGTLYYQDNGSDILSIGYTGYPNLVWNPPVPMGLPHFLGKTWTGTHSWAYGTYTVSGKVLSEGQISTPLGSYPALLVRYYYQTDVLSYYNYQWETREYGIIAYANTLNNGMLYVLNQADPNIVSVEDMVQAPFFHASIGPNPFSSELSLAVISKADKPVSVSIYDLKGRLVCSGEYSLKAGAELSLDLTRDMANRAVGIYFVSIETGGEKLVKIVTKVR